MISKSIFSNVLYFFSPNLIVSLPKKPEMMCQFLYGVEWNTPLKKNISYRMEIVDNKPLLIKRSFLGSLTRWFKTKLSIN